MPPEGMAKVQNIEELNGIKDFTEGQKKLMARGALSEFMEDVALATDLDKDTSDEDRRVDDDTPSQRIRISSCFCCGNGRRPVSKRHEYEYKK
jgi:hypothetical protein